VNLARAGETLLHLTPPGQLVGKADLRGLIALAYGVEPHERIVTAEPDAASALDEFFDVRALPPVSPSPPTREEALAMTRQMLAERFGLQVRIDTELARATVLRVIEPGVTGPGLRPAPEDCTPLPRGANRYDARFSDAFRRSCVLTVTDDRLRGTVTLDEFARVLSVLAGRPVLNRTDLDGLFTIDVAMARTSFAQSPAARFGGPDPVLPDAPTEAPAFVDALRARMGLTAGTERQPIRLIVVEHVGPLVEN
jgi:uncharacterized protein (TIGR03435 family)